MQALTNKKDALINRYYLRRYKKESKISASGNHTNKIEDVKNKLHIMKNTKEVHLTKFKEYEEQIQICSVPSAG